MLSWLNFVTLIACSFLFSFFYVRSVRPAALEKKIGVIAYEKCGWYRDISSLFMMIVCANYVLYYWVPLPLPMPRTFPWAWKISAAIALVTAIPSLYLMYRGITDAGAETMRPREDH